MQSSISHSHSLQRPRSHRVTSSIARDSEETVISEANTGGTATCPVSMSITYDRILKNQTGTTLTQCMSALPKPQSIYTLVRKRYDGLFNQTHKTYVYLQNKLAYKQELSSSDS